MNFPATSAALQAAGWEYTNDGVCRGCQAKIEWWISPRGKKMPMSVISTATIQHATGDVRQPHFADCPEADQFRKKKP
jgi:hypothetical protein